MIHKSDAIAAIDGEINKQKDISEDIIDAPGWEIYIKAMVMAKDAINKLPLLELPVKKEPTPLRLSPLLEGYFNPYEKGWNDCIDTTLKSWEKED